METASTNVTAATTPARFNVLFEYEYSDWEKVLSLSQYILVYEKTKKKMQRDAWRKMGAEKELRWMKKELNKLRKRNGQ